MQVRKQQLELDMEKHTGSKSAKEYFKAVNCHPDYIPCMQSTSWGNSGLDEAQAGIETAERNINNLRYEDDITVNAESEEELWNLFMKVKEESEKIGIKFNIQKTIMAFCPINPWQIDGETVETVTDFNFGAPKSL